MNNSKKKYKNDVILTVLVLALALVCFLIFKACAKEGSVVVISVDGEVYKRLSLDTDAVVEVVSGENGEYKNTVEVKDGRVRVVYANCPDGICEKHRSIKYSSESIVCLPHRLSVTVEGESSNGADLTTK